MNDAPIVVTIAVTAGYNYALTIQARHVAANLTQFPEGGAIVFATDKDDTVEEAIKVYRALGPQWEIHVLKDRYTDNPKNYQNDAQLTIAQMRQTLCDKARALRARYTWSLDSDVLPLPNALRCMIDAVTFDSGYYGVATCPYISQGGGGWLFGRGDYKQNIMPNLTEDERAIPEELAARLAAMRQAPGDFSKEEWDAANRELEGCPPMGNIFELNGKRWKRRGWGEWAYPAIGKGAIVPSDWCGWGNTLLSARALALADFTGYAGYGTEDLFVIFRKWKPSGIRIAALPHCPAHHVIRDSKNPGRYILCYARHEEEGEHEGHLRVDYLPFYSHAPGERFRAD